MEAVVRDLVGRVCTELREELLEHTDGPELRRLFPPAYKDDPRREEAYEALVRDDLVTSRLRALDTVITTVDDDHITPDQGQQWLQALNAVRLTLGTQLDVSEDRDPTEFDEDDPHLPQLLVYDLLSVMLGSLLAAIPR